MIISELPNDKIRQAYIGKSKFNISFKKGRSGSDVEVEVVPKSGGSTAEGPNNTELCFDLCR